jgi:diaminopimelate epimerase
MTDMAAPSEGLLHFRKMHGLGNDFVVIDARGRRDPITPALARALGDRHRGIGFDQLVVIAPDAEAGARVTFWNPDGSTAGACGNATRCVADLLMRETGREAVTLRSAFGLLRAARAGNDLVTVDMGVPQFDWRAIPLADPADTLHLPLDGDPAAVSMGNPHCVFFVPDAAAVPLAVFGPTIENHPLFPERCNVEVVQVIDRRTLRARVWERGAGITLACGSGACALAAAAIRRGLCDRQVAVHLDGGMLTLDWPADDAGIRMTGPVAHVFEGSLSLAGLES